MSEEIERFFAVASQNSENIRKAIVKNKEEEKKEPWPSQSSEISTEI